ncbi:unnamed protein product [Parnassius mnemosyne]|uniref:Gustatory receptor n=1 Tax=Parnassius mnemosyne TaxID=213953 RepID=A0AAV1KSY5_9NEOP
MPYHVYRCHITSVTVLGIVLIIVVSESVVQSSMDLTPSENINWKLNYASISSIRPLLLLEKCYGIIRVHVIGSSYYIPVDWKMKLFGFLIYLLIAVIYLIFGIGFTVKTGNFLEAVELLPSILIFFQYSITIIMQSFSDEDTKRILLSFDKIDEMLRITMNEEFYKKSRSQTNKLLILLCGSFLVIIIFNIFNEVEIRIGHVVILFMYFQCNLEIFTFIKLTDMLQERLFIINNYLTKFTQYQQFNKILTFHVCVDSVYVDGCVNYIGPVSPSNRKLCDLSATYNKIGELCQILIKNFCCLIFTSFISIFSFIIITFWTSLYSFKADKDLRYLLKVIVLSTLEVFIVSMMCLKCEKILKIRNCTKILVNKIIMNYDLPKSMRIQAKTFMEVIEVSPLRVSIYDMFTIDLQIIFKFISLCATYLIVVIQVNHFI